MRDNTINIEEQYARRGTTILQAAKQVLNNIETSDRSPQAAPDYIFALFLDLDRFKHQR
jgi:hypothetical protein